MFFHPREDNSNFHNHAGELHGDPLPSRMQTFLALASLLAFYVCSVQATALTYRLNANEKACFFNNVENTGAKVAFYFAVSSQHCLFRHSACV